MKYIKQLLKSKTVLLALAQGVVGVLMAVSSQLGDMNLLGYAMICKTIADILLRAITVSPISKK